MSSLPAVLTQVQAVGRERVGERARHEQLEAILEEMQADASPRHGVVAMGHRIDERFEHRALAPLWDLPPPEVLDRRDAHVATHEVQRLDRLAVEGPADVARVELVVPVRPLAPVGHRLDHRVGQPDLRLRRGQEHAGNAQAGCALLVLDDQPELAKIGLGAGRSCAHETGRVG